MTTLRIPLHQDPWSLLELPENLVVSGRAKVYPLEKTVGSRKYSKNDARFVKMFKIQILFEVV